MIICQINKCRRFKYTAYCLSIFTNLLLASVQTEVSHRPMQSSEITFWWIFRQVWQSMEIQSALSRLGKNIRFSASVHPTSLRYSLFFFPFFFFDLRTISVLPSYDSHRIFPRMCLTFYSAIGNVISHCHGLNIHFHFPLNYVHKKPSLAHVSSFFFFLQNICKHDITYMLYIAL